MSSTLESRISPRLAAAIYALLAGLSVAAFYDTGALYDDYALRLGHGVQSIVESELVFYIWYALWGTAAGVFGTLALIHTALPDRLEHVLEKFLSRPRFVAGVAACLVLAGALAFRVFVLLDHAIADDEATYVFQARTLLHGRISNPAPPFAPFYANQFIVVGEQGWYGQYPIGHPLLLALGELLHARWLVVPLIGACAVMLTFAVGTRLFGAKHAAVAACLLVLSPQFLWTHATELSQPGAACFILLGMWSLLQLQDTGRWRWAVVSGLAWGFALLIRPMPGALVLVAAVASHIATQLSSSSRNWRKLVLQLGAASLGVALGLAGIAITNYVESGSPFVSAYKTLHGQYGALPDRLGYTSNSLGGAFLRQNFWLFGWTLSFAFLPFTRPRRGALLFWGVILADYAYRLMVPKTVVATTGPIYVFEAVPLLVLGSVDGAVRLARSLADIGVARARAKVAAAALASTLVALVTFVPVEVRAIYLGGVARQRVFDLIEQSGAEHALIFANHLLAPERGLSWAYFPPNPSPDLDDPLLFVRQPPGVGGPRAAYEFWKHQFPDRRAFLYSDTLQGQLFYELSAGMPPATSSSLVDLVQAREP